MKSIDKLNIKLLIICLCLFMSLTFTAAPINLGSVKINIVFNNFIYLLLFIFVLKEIKTNCKKSFENIRDFIMTNGLFCLFLFFVFNLGYY